jgi:hypothetical protein
MIVRPQFIKVPHLIILITVQIVLGVNYSSKSPNLRQDITQSVIVILENQANRASGSN